jgi:serine/threonine-protein kinase
MSTNSDSDRWRRLCDVLDAVLARDPLDWPEVLDATCAGAPDLRREAQELLDRVDDASRFLASPPTSAAAALVAEAEGATAAGRRVGAYSIVREIGRGGMSRVFLARRADGHFEQHVALKLLRPGLDTEIDRSRFRAERQIVALLNHPNIARLLDGGLTDADQPYLVLEYVDGLPIDAYCDTHALPVSRRLELFLKAAEATQYAHRNLIVHRDIKASNIFVASDGTVKLLDFGLAKLLEPPGYDRELAGTQTVAHWMTPEYAAPEQIKRGAVTTLTDVYQLGVVLYRLLANRLPFTTTSADLRELVAAVLRGDPEPPSTVVANSDPGRARLLRGDLDAIVLKALRREPDERFASVEALADDLRRYLSGHPIRARRNTAVYRARRFVRRHRVETLAALGVLIAVLLAAGFSMTQARRARTQRDLAAAASRESQAATSFVMGLFETSDPAEARGDTLTAQELVRRAAARAERLGDRPLVQAQMIEVTGRLDGALGRYDDALTMFRRALDIRRAEGTGESPETARTLVQLADVLVRVDRYDAADSAAREALRIQTASRGNEGAAVAITLHQLGSIAVFQGQLSVAEAFHRRALAVRERALGRNDSLTAASHLTLGAMFRREGRLADAERELRAGRAILEQTVSTDNPELAEALIQIAYLLDEDRGQFAEADPLYRRALEIRKRAFGDGHPMVAATLFDYADFLTRRGDFTTAVALGRQGMEIIRRAYAKDHPVVANFTGRLAVIVEHAGDVDEATILFRQAIDIVRRVRGQDHDAVAGLEMNLARLLVNRRQYVAAESLARDAYTIRERRSGSASPGTAEAGGLVGMLLTREKKYAAADSVLRESLRTMERQVGREQRDVKELYGWLADLDDARGLHDEALRYRAIAGAR